MHILQLRRRGKKKKAKRTQSQLREKHFSTNKNSSLKKAHTLHLTMASRGEVLPFLRSNMKRQLSVSRRQFTQPGQERETQ